MGQRRTQRVASLLLEEVSQILIREVQDPRTAGVTLTGVHISADLRLATIYFTTFLPTERDQALAGLESASRYIRSHISRRLSLRYIPEIRFVYDPAREQAERMESLLKQIAEEK